MPRCAFVDLLLGDSVLSLGSRVSSVGLGGALSAVEGGAQAVEVGGEVLEVDVAGSDILESLHDGLDDVESGAEIHGSYLPFLIGN